MVPTCKLREGTTFYFRTLRTFVKIYVGVVWLPTIHSQNNDGDTEVVELGVCGLFVFLVDLIESLTFLNETLTWTSLFKLIKNGLILGTEVRGLLQMTIVWTDVITAKPLIEVDTNFRYEVLRWITFWQEVFGDFRPVSILNRTYVELMLLKKNYFYGFQQPVHPKFFVVYLFGLLRD